MSIPRRARSFEATDDLTITAEGGQLAHRDHVVQSNNLLKKFHEVTKGVWCFVGNGLSNQTFVEAPEGIIAFDTGESNEEMRNAIRELRTHTSRPIVAVMYTHFHYVGGTRAVFEETGHDVPVWGHEKVALNRVRTATEISPAYGRGLLEQFAMTLPLDGPDGLVNVGLGIHFRNPEHAPHTYGFVEPTHTFGAASALTVAGLSIEMTPAPSDADDSVTYWIPSLGVAINNLVWPVLFNVFAIRGEEYRDPQVMLKGVDHLLSLLPEHLVGAHGNPISGRELIAERVTRYRDSIQFMWDQTVRLTNRGYSSTELADAIRLPALYDDDNLTSEYYGVTEHHVRQIRSGLFGFFDGDEGNLFPLPRPERSNRLVAALGGRNTVREQVREALDNDDIRWALELASWLAYSAEAEHDDHLLLAEALRTVARRTPSANIRNWCLARARHHDGTLDLGRFNTHRLGKKQLLGAAVEDSVHILRVLLDPELVKGINIHIGWKFSDGRSAGLHIRNGIACKTNGIGASTLIECEHETWVNVITGTDTLNKAIEQKRARITADETLVRTALSAFDLPGLQQ